MKKQDVIIFKELVHEGEVIAQIKQLDGATVMASWKKRCYGTNGDWFPSVRSAQLFIRGWVYDFGKWRNPIK